jgi:trehalose-6-phosphatase
VTTLDLARVDYQPLVEFGRRRPLLLGFDYDGVLSAICQVPDEARLEPEVAQVLTALAGLPGVWVALVSGRSLADLRSRVPAEAGVALVGSHGAELDLTGWPGLAAPSGPEAAGPGHALPTPDADLVGRLHDWSRAWERNHPGAYAEFKPLGVALHTRRCAPDGATVAKAEWAAGPANWPGVHVLPGKEVVDLSASRPDKGAALLGLARLLPAGCGILFAGDDVTDEAAFRRLRPEAGDFGLKVGDEATLAGYRLRRQSEVVVALGQLLAARPADNRVP